MERRAGVHQKAEREREGKGYLYRLPSEVEWEYACRGGATSEEECSYHFYFAKPTNDLSSKEANFNGNFPFGKADKGPYLGRTTKVGSYAPNKVGLYDMHGNVWQWCEDLWEKGARTGCSGAAAGATAAASAGRRSASGTRRPTGTASSASGLPEFPSGSRPASKRGANACVARGLSGHASSRRHGPAEFVWQAKHAEPQRRNPTFPHFFVPLKLRDGGGPNHQSSPVTPPTHRRAAVLNGTRRGWTRRRADSLRN